MKQTVGAEDAVRQLQMEVAEPGNGNGQNLIEAPQQGGFEWAWLLWLNRRTVGRWTLCGIVLATIVAILIPKQYESTTQSHASRCEVGRRPRHGDGGSDG